MKINIASLTGSELVALYNEHAEKPVKKFSDKTTALRRVAAVLTEAGVDFEGAVNRSKSAAKTAAKKRKAIEAAVEEVAKETPAPKKAKKAKAAKAAKGDEPKKTARPVEAKIAQGDAPLRKPAKDGEKISYTAKGLRYAFNVGFDANPPQREGSASAASWKTVAKLIEASEDGTTDYDAIIAADVEGEPFRTRDLRYWLIRGWFLAYDDEGNVVPFAHERGTYWP